ncbi:hypothetical protein [Ralstonia sp. ASV6]|uniref:hypothetical protein n=1 Tax=Ralstonia sp. ASV6 TaxID=2795124 RepID=UPI0018EC4845|nr:hypothetical protein [Ralstonia sp. ASV6]
MSTTVSAWVECAVMDLGSNTMHQSGIQASQHVRDLLTGTVLENRGLDVPTNNVVRALATEQAGRFMLMARLYPAWERGYTAADIREAGRRWPDVYPPRVVALAEAFEAEDSAVAVADAFARPLLREELQLLMRGVG